jgi:hypothetical protein
MILFKKTADIDAEQYATARTGVRKVCHSEKGMGIGSISSSSSPSSQEFTRSGTSAMSQSTSRFVWTIKCNHVKLFEAKTDK